MLEARDAALLLENDPRAPKRFALQKALLTRGTCSDREPHPRRARGGDGCHNCALTFSIRVALASAGDHRGPGRPGCLITIGPKLGASLRHIAGGRGRLVTASTTSRLPVSRGWRAPQSEAAGVGAVPQTPGIRSRWANRSYRVYAEYPRRSLLAQQAAICTQRL